MAVSSARYDGSLASWNEDRGFGFIAPAAGGPQVFVHLRALPQGSAVPAVGAQLSYEVEARPDGKTRARYVRVVGSKAGQRYGSAQSDLLSYLPIVAFVVIYAVVQVLWHPPYWVGVLYVGASLVGFLIYAADKSAAVQGRWRVSESALLLLGLAGGWPGAIIAQRVLHHKTKKRSFQAAFAGSIVVNVAAFVLLASPLLGGLIASAAAS